MAQPFQDYGVGPTGFVLPTFTQVQTEVRTLLGAKLGFTVDDSTTLAGMFADVFAEALTRMWEEHYNIWLSGQLSTDGDNLAHITQQVGIVPQVKKRSTGSVVTTGTPGLLLPAGRQFRDVTSGDVWQTTADSLIGIGTVDVESVEYGAIAGGPSHTYEIVTQSAGWNGVVWSVDAVPGFLAESSSALRARHASLLTGVGKAYAAGIPIRAAILDVAGVTDCTVVVNDSDSTVDGISAHSFRATVVGGVDQDIGVAIWNSKRLGGGSVGAVAVVVTDDDGINHTVSFDRATNNSISIVVSVEKNSAVYPTNGDALIETIVEDYVSERGLGATIEYLVIFHRIYSQVPGLLQLIVEIGDTLGTETAENLVIDPQQVPVLTNFNLVVL